MNDEELDDGQLLESITGEDRATVEALYAPYSGPVYSLAMHLLRDPRASEEVTQDTFFNVWRRGSSYKSNRGSVTACLFSIAHHRAIDELRKWRRDQTRIQHGIDMSQKPSEAGADDPTEYATAQYEASRLRDALTTLHPEQRDVVVLAYFGGFTHTETALKLDQPSGNGKDEKEVRDQKTQECNWIQESGVGGVWNA